MMRTISVTMFMTLDGVVQGLGRADEDTRGGFAHGGWGRQYNDDAMAQEMGKGMADAGDLLFGRRKWQDFHAAWGHATDGNPFTTLMNCATKYVASRTLHSADEWENSLLLPGDAASSVAELKAQPGNDLLGSGARLFEGPAPLTEFDLTGSVTTTKGVIIAHYSRR